MVSKINIGQMRPLMKNFKMINLDCVRSVNTGCSTPKFIFRQLFDRLSCTYTYLLADPVSRESILIDPVIEHAGRDMKLLQDLDLRLKYSVNTHVHADHITGSGLLKKLLPNSKSLLSKASGGIADVFVSDKDKFSFGDIELEVRSTPGHTYGCTTYVSHDYGLAFTGDALLIRGCGRTDFQEGNSETLYNSVHSQIFSLPDEYVVFPAHDYNGHESSTVYEEKKYNPRLTKSKEEFIAIMDNLGLPYPNRIDESLPANKVCGLHKLPPYLEELFQKTIEDNK